MDVFWSVRWNSTKFEKPINNIAEKIYSVIIGNVMLENWWSTIWNKLEISQIVASSIVASNSIINLSNYLPIDRCGSNIEDSERYQFEMSKTKENWISKDISIFYFLSFEVNSVESAWMFDEDCG